MLTDASVADLDMEASTPPMRTKLPAGTSSTGMLYLPASCRSAIGCGECTE